MSSNNLSKNCDAVPPIKDFYPNDRKAVSEPHFNTNSGFKLVCFLAAFKDDDQIDFEELGITPTREDFENSVWKELWINPKSIVSMWENDTGNTNIQLTDGDVWSVKGTLKSNVCKLT
jgi:hypothetical protein